MASVRLFEKLKNKKRLREDAETFKKTKIVKKSSYYFEKKPIYNPPFFVMRRRAMDEIYRDRDNKSKQLIRDYHLALFKASIKALNSDVIEVFSESQNRYTLNKPEYRYVRDPVVVLHDIGLILSTEGNKKYLSDEIIKKIQEQTGYHSIQVKNSYFEGGNVFYVPQKKCFLHGFDPDGHYSKTKTSYYTTPRKDYYKIDPAITNKNIDNLLKKYGIKVKALALNPKLIAEDQDDVIMHYYFHLDCFMQLIPDGRLMILNKNILSKRSQKKLTSIFGDNFIDLAYPDYQTNPMMFNFIAIPKDDSFAIISPTLPDSVIESLEKQGLQVITPETLTAGSARYNSEFAAKIVKELEKEGFIGMTPMNLATHLATNQKGYYLCNGITASALLKTTFRSADDEYKKTPIKFVYGGGGPHCLTNEVNPSSIVGYTYTLKNVGFFKPLPIFQRDANDNGLGMSIATSYHR